MAFLVQASSTRNRAIISDEVNDFPRLPAAADPWFLSSQAIRIRRDSRTPFTVCQVPSTYQNGKEI